MNRTQNPQDIFAPAAIRLYVFLITTLLIYAAVVLYRYFPNAYVWEELFINYEGGFIRRGLLGQIFFLIDRVVPISLVYPVLYAVLFYIFLYVSYKKLVSVFDPIVVAFLFICPVLFLLPATDRYVFGRKDLFLEILLLCIAQACIRCFAQGKPALYRNTLYISFFFMLGTLIHEMMIFYFPLFAVLLGAAYARLKKMPQWLLITGGLFVAALLSAVIFPGDTDMREAVCASWRQSYPELSCKRAMRFIGVSLYDNTMLSWAHHRNLITMGSVFLGAALSAIPLVFLWKAYRPSAAIRDLFSASPLLRFAFWPAVCAPFLLSVLANDFGRHISAAFVSWLFFLYAVFAVRPQAAAPWLYMLKEAIAASPRRRWAVYLFSLAYGLCWRMIHHAPVGESLVIPGVLLYLQ